MSHTIFSYPLTVREHHLDTFGHMNNSVYLQILEEARWELVSQNGYGLNKIKECGKGPVILEIKLLFSRELLLRDHITIHTQLASYEGKIAILKQWITNHAGKTCCEAEFKIALFDTLQRKIIKPTPEWLHAIGSKSI